MHKIKKTLDVEVPEPPRFLRRNQGFTAVHIKYLSDEELREIGEKWTQMIIKMAHEARLKDPLADLGL